MIDVAAMLAGPLTRKGERFGWGQGVVHPEAACPRCGDELWRCPVAAGVFGWLAAWQPSWRS